MMISGSWKMNIFEVLKQDIDTFILISNYLINLGNRQTNSSSPVRHKASDKNERIRVNDKTATGGWF